MHQPEASNLDIPNLRDDTAPELKGFHNQMFSKAEAEQGDFYGAMDQWPPIKRSGHFRRMKILAGLDLGKVSEKSVVDFGTGPWGFGCVFPILRNARRCYGIDVSSKALEIAASQDWQLSGRIDFIVSDGEEIKLDDGAIDIFWGGEVIEHVREPRRFIQEVARVCRDEADVVLSTPNRDAVYYLSRAEDYAIGPEHIALMNQQELLDCLSPFLTDIKVVGYETSLSPELDESISNEVAMDVIQRRAALCPESASGLIVSGRVDKSLYRRNRRSYILHEYIWSSPAISGGAWSEPKLLFGDILGAGICQGKSLSVKVLGARAILLFWAHAWSGMVRVEVGDVSRELDLYSPNGGFRRLEIPLNETAEQELCISPLGRKSERSLSDEVIFYKVMVYEVRPWSKHEIDQGCY